MVGTAVDWSSNQDERVCNEIIAGTAQFNMFFYNNAKDWLYFIAMLHDSNKNYNIYWTDGQKHSYIVKLIEKNLTKENENFQSLTNPAKPAKCKQ